jgi:IclR family KDG regulon transcriptional repressor
MAPTNRKSAVKTLDRLVSILDSFSREKPSWSLAELSEKLAYPKSSLHRFLCGLETHGILWRDPSSKRWHLGYRLFAWGHLAAENTHLIHAARPFMNELAASTEETTLLTVYQQHEIICVEKVESSHPVRMTLDVGTRRNPHAGASSKVLMAYLPPQEIEEILRERGLPKLCANTITDSDQLLAELAKIRAQGYALSYEETDRGAWGIATPIFGRHNIVVAAIGIAGPLSRYREELVEAYVHHCREASQRITRSLSQDID